MVAQAQLEQLRPHWDEHSYILLRNFIPRDQAAQLLRICEHAMGQWFVREPHYGQPGGNEDSSWLMRHVNHPAYFRDRRDWLATLLDFIADERVEAVAKRVMGEPPVFICTSFWFNPRGVTRNGGWHRDSQFITNTEEEERQLLFGPKTTTGVQLQIALVPSDDTEVVPGSHRRWDTPHEYEIRKGNPETDDMPGALRVALQPGDAVAFNPLALHRGRYHADKPRRTLMLSYNRLSTEQSHDYFTNQPWILEPDYFDGTQPRTRAFLQRTIDACSRNWGKGDKFRPV